MESDSLVIALDQPASPSPVTSVAIAPGSDTRSALPSTATAAAVSAATLLAACGGGEEEPPLVLSPLAEEQFGGFRFTQLSTDADAARLLQQAQFSSTRSEISALRSEGATMWLARQYQTPLRSSGWDWVESQGYGAVDSNEYYFSTNPAEYMLWNQLLSGPDMMRKRMALALSEFFVSSLNSAEFTWRSHAYASWWDMLVRNAFGNFRALLEDVTLHPAMGYLPQHQGQPQRGHPFWPRARRKLLARGDAAVHHWPGEPQPGRHQPRHRELQPGRRDQPGARVHRLRLRPLRRRAPHPAQQQQHHRVQGIRPQAHVAESPPTTPPWKRVFWVRRYLQTRPRRKRCALRWTRCSTTPMLARSLPAR